MQYLKNNNDAQPDLYLGDRTYYFWNFHQSAKCDLEDQYVCLWWTGKCIFLDFLTWYVLEKANKAGAISAIIGGTVCYCVTMFFGWKIANLHQILIGISVSLLCMVIGSVVGKKNDDTVLKLYF